MNLNLVSINYIFILKFLILTLLINFNSIARADNSQANSVLISKPIIIRLEKQAKKNCKIYVYSTASAQPDLSSPEWSGTCKGGFADGNGKLVEHTDSGSVRTTSATYVKGVATGPGSLQVLRVPGVNFIVRGTFVDGKVQGVGEVTFDAGTGITARYKGDLVDGVSEGKGRTESTESTYTGEYREGAYDGHGRLEFANRYYEGEFRKGELHGPGKLQYNAGAAVTGFFKNNKFPTTGRYEYTDRSIYEGQLGLNGLPDGIGQLNSSTGVIFNGQFKNGAPNGPGTHTFNGRSLSVMADGSNKFTRVYSEAELNAQRAMEQQAKEQADLRTQYEEAQQQEAQRRVNICMAAMLMRPTSTGSFGTSMGNAVQCQTDPNAYLIPLPPRYNCSRDGRGGVQCNPN